MVRDCGIDIYKIYNVYIDLCKYKHYSPKTTDAVIIYAAELSNENVYLLQRIAHHLHVKSQVIYSNAAADDDDDDDN
jgi:hypothetical protein